MTKMRILDVVCWSHCCITRVSIISLLLSEIAAPWGSVANAHTSTRRCLGNRRLFHCRDPILLPPRVCLTASMFSKVCFYSDVISVSFCRKNISDRCGTLSLKIVSDVSTSRAPFWSVAKRSQGLLRDVMIAGHTDDAVTREVALQFRCNVRCKGGILILGPAGEDEVAGEH